MKKTSRTRIGLGLALAALCAAGPAAAQTIPHVTGTFKTPEGKTPEQAGLQAIATIGAVTVYGTVDFQPYDARGRRPLRILCGGVTYLPQRVRGWIRGDGALVDNYTGAAGVDLVPEIGCAPAGLVMRAFAILAPSADGRIPSISWSEDKQIPQQASVDWGALAAAGITAPTYTGYSTIQDEGVSLPARAIVNLTGTGVACADDAPNSRTTCEVKAGGSLLLNLENPTPADTGKFQWKAKNALTVTRVSCSVDSGTVSVNLEVRSESTPNSPGTAVLAVPLVCAPGSAATSTFFAPVVPASSPVALMITTTSGSPAVVRVSAEYQLN